MIVATSALVIDAFGASSVLFLPLTTPAFRLSAIPLFAHVEAFPASTKGRSASSSQFAKKACPVNPVSFIAKAMMDIACSLVIL